MYQIAERFPIEARRYAASLAYTPEHSSDIDGPAPRARIDGSSLGFCPLGACLHYMGSGGPSAAPTAEEVRQALVMALGVSSGQLEDYLDDPDIAVINQEANRFIAAWDGGHITDLAEALGVRA